MTTGPVFNPLYIALDTTDVAEATRLARCLGTSVGGLKLGLEYFARHGHDGVRTIQEASPLPLFLDLKFHDIPNTVAGAVRSVMPLAPQILNVHAMGGTAMMVAARASAHEEAARQGIPAPRLLAVTVLTSLNDPDLHATGIDGAVTDQVRRLAALTAQAGLDGVVCSAREAAVLRADLGPDFLLVTPGVRPTWAAHDDQKRIVTPREALDAGSNILVVGRPITATTDPLQAAHRLMTDLQAEGAPA